MGRPRTAEDPGCLLTVADLDAFEAEHGAIPRGSWLILRTGWGDRAADSAAFLNTGPDGPVAPGPDVEAARWLARHPAIVGFGVETVGIDAGAAGSFDPVFQAHHLLLGAGRYGLTQLTNVAALPPVGALIVVAPLKLVGSTGSPARACSRSSPVSRQRSGPPSPGVLAVERVGLDAREIAPLTPVEGDSPDRSRRELDCPGASMRRSCRPDPGPPPLESRGGVHIRGSEAAR